MQKALLQTGIWTGFGLVIGAAVIGNVAFYNLNRAVNKAYGIRHRVSPWTGVFPERPGMKQVMERVRLYRTAYGNGIYWKRMKLAYWMVGIGLALVMTSNFLAR